MSIINDPRIVAKAEVTYDTDSIPTGSELIRTRNLSMTPYAGTRITPEYDADGRRFRADINTQPSTVYSFDIDYAGSGTAGTAPSFGPIVEACGMSESISPGVSVTYAIETSPDASVTIWGVRDEGTGQQLTKTTGVRGEIGISLQSGQLPTFNFRNMIGSYVRPVYDGTPLTESVSNQEKGIPVNKTNTTTLTIASETICCESIVFDNLGWTANRRNNPNCQETFLTPQRMTGTAVFLDPGINTKDWYAAVESHASTPTENAYSIVHGTAAGSILTLSGSKLVLTDIQETDVNGIKALTCPFVLLDNWSLVLT
jgi:hypothetical protein